jgi:hypothetical protein
MLFYQFTIQTYTWYSDPQCKIFRRIRVQNKAQDSCIYSPLFCSMGATVSLYQATMLPPTIDKDYFTELTKHKFTSASYDAFADHNGKVSKARMVEIASMTDCYLSHEWGIDKEGRNTSERVRKLNKFLQSMGLYTYFDEGQIYGKNPQEMIKEKIKNAQCVIICMTERYFYQINLEGENPTKLEFFESMDNKDLRYIIPLVMEKAAFKIPEWIVQRYPQFNVKTHLNLSTYGDIGNDDKDVHSDVMVYVTRSIRPLREGGSFKQQRSQFLSTIVGRHYKWMLKHLPKFGHVLCLEYAEKFGEHEIESTSRLWQLLQHDINFLQTININAKDAKLIRDALKEDLESNMDTRNIKQIDALIAYEAQLVENEIQHQRNLNQESIDMRIRFSENTLMSVEDELSRGDREQCRMDRQHDIYLQGRARLLRIADKHHEHYKDILFEMRAAQRKRDNDNDAEWRRYDYNLIGRITHPVEASGALYRLFIKIDRATVHLLKDTVYLDDPEHPPISTSSTPGSVALKRNRIQSFIDRSTILGMMETMEIEQKLREKPPPGTAMAPGPIFGSEKRSSKFRAITAGSEKSSTGARGGGGAGSGSGGGGGGGDDARAEDAESLDLEAAAAESIETLRNGRLVYLIQEAAYICRCMINLCEYNTENVALFGESGAVKLLTALLAQVYLFSCSFESFFMPMSFHFLNMPGEVILAIRYLIKCGVGWRNINAKLGYLFVEAGAIELCVEIVRFHLNDIGIVKDAVELLFVLIDLPNPGTAQASIEIFMKDPNNLILLIMVMEKYGNTTENVTAPLLSCLIGVISFAMQSRKYDDLLRICRGQIVGLVFNTLLPMAGQPRNVTDLELQTRICVCLNNFYFSVEHQDSHFFTSEFVPKNESFARDVSKQLNTPVALKFLKMVLAKHAKHDILAISALITLGNMTFNNNRIKKEAYKLKLHEAVTSILRDRMKTLDVISASARTAPKHSSSHGPGATPWRETGNVCASNSEMSPLAPPQRLHQQNQQMLMVPYTANSSISASLMATIPSPYDSCSVGAEDSQFEQQEQEELAAIDSDILREVLFEGLITAANMIVTPPFLTLDTLKPDAGAGLEELVRNFQLKNPAAKAVTAAAATTANLSSPTRGAGAGTGTGTGTGAAGIDAATNLAASNGDEKPGALAYFLKNGMAELAMDVISNYNRDRVLVRSMLIFVNKFAYRGRFATSSRLVTLRFCEQVFIACMCVHIFV